MMNKWLEKNWRYFISCGEEGPTRGSSSLISPWWDPKKLADEQLVVFSFFFFTFCLIWNGFPGALKVHSHFFVCVPYSSIFNGEHRCQSTHFDMLYIIMLLVHFLIQSTPSHMCHTFCAQGGNFLMKQIKSVRNRKWEYIFHFVILVTLVRLDKSLKKKSKNHT